MNQRDQIIKLYLSGETGRKIARELSLSRYKVYSLLKEEGITRTQSQIRSGKKLSEKHKKQISKGLRSSKKKIGAPRAKLKKGYEIPTEDLAYIFGVLFGDGYFCKGAIGLEAKDLDFVESFATAVKNHFGITPRMYKNAPRELTIRNQIWTNKGSYVCRAFSVDLEAFCKKNLSLDWIKNKPKKLKIAFLRGLWDSEGSICSSSQQVSFCNKNKDIIELYDELLKTLLNIIPAHKTNKYQVIYSVFGKQKQIEDFFEIVHPSIDRKWGTLLDLFFP